MVVALRAAPPGLKSGRVRGLRSLPTLLATLRPLLDQREADTSDPGVGVFCVAYGRW